MAEEQLYKILNKLQSKAYIGASVDTVFYTGKKCTAYLFVGERYEWASLRNGNIQPAFLSATGFRERLYNNQPFYYREVVEIQEKLLTYLENHGYPFACVYLDSLRISDDKISAGIYYEKGPQIFFDAIKIVTKNRNPKKKKKNKVITKGFISSYLGIKKGKLYNEKVIKKMQTRLSSLRYLSSYQSPYIVFVDNKAEVNLFLMNRPSSKIDVLFGFLPGKDPQTGEQRYDFTGNINIDLINPLNTGKRLQFKWQQIKAGTSDLMVGFQWPYILKTSLGFDFAFKLYKRDSAYIDIISDVGLQYMFNGNSYLKAFWINTTTNLININTSQILSTRQLPNMLDINNASFGLAFYYDKLDYKYNPRKGFETNLVASFAIKNIRRNNTIEELKDPQDPSINFSGLYDTINLRSFQYRFILEHSHFFQLWKWSTLMTRIHSGLIVSDSPVYANETFRIGGNRRLRGFDEESILCTWYNVLSLEWRFLFGKNSYAYLFGDFAYLQDKSIGENQEDFPVGFGVGVALETKVGVFGLSYALGTQKGNPILFNNSKVHFGYVYSF